MVGRVVARVVVREAVAMVAVKVGGVKVEATEVTDCEEEEEGSTTH